MFKNIIQLEVEALLKIFSLAGGGEHYPTLSTHCNSDALLKIYYSAEGRDTVTNILFRWR